MTTVDAAPDGDAHVDPGLAADLEDLRTVLADVSFPAAQDDLIAVCLGLHAPTRLACRLSRIPRETVYPDLDAVLADVEAAALGLLADS